METPLVTGGGARPAALRPWAQLRRHLPLLAVLALVAPLYFVWSGTDRMGDFANDGPNYLMMAQHFAHPAQRDVAAQVAAVSRFPPLYPLLLAWSGAAGELRAVHAVTTAAFVLALCAYYFWLLGEGLAPAAAAAAVLLCAALPESWLLGLTVQSEYLYLLCSLLALGALAAWRRQARVEARRLEALYAAALLVGAAALTRTIGVVLLLPLLLAARRAPPRAAALALLLALAPLALWHLLHRAEHSYQSQLAEIYGRGPWRLLAGQVQRELPALRQAFLDEFGAAPALRLLLGAFGAASVACAAWRAWRGRPDAQYLLAYAAILLLWPYPEEAVRFVWAVLPVLAVQPLLALGSVPRALPLRPWAGIALAALVAVAVAPSLARAAGRFRTPSALPDARAYTAWYQADLGLAQQDVNAEIVMMEDLRKAGASVPPQDCVIAVRPDLVNFYGGRRAAQVPLASVPDPEFQRRLRATGCAYVFMHTRTDASYPDALHPLARLGDGIDVLYYNATANPPGSTNFVISMLARLK